MERNEASLLQTEHFHRRNGVWVYRSRIHNDDKSTSLSVAVVVEELPDGRYAGYIPMTDDPVMTDDVDGIPQRGLRYISPDVRDMIALVLGEKASARMELYGTGTDIGFEDEKTKIYVTMPFNGGPWYDYAIDHRSPTGSYHELTAPEKIFGEAYIEWRNAYCHERQDMNSSPRKP